MIDTLFPFGFPPATAQYLALYVITLVVHVVFMNYVLAGSAYLAMDAMRPAHCRAADQIGTAAALLRDWMPFALSAAITAGVAPLLFVQILYQERFYTANLLLFHRWMSILPVLIVGFYALYLLKRPSAPRRNWVRVAIGLAPFAAIAFTAASWTENHLLSQQPQQWPSFYESGRMVYRSPEMLPRLLVWSVGSVPTACLLLAWQMRREARRGRPAGLRSLSHVAAAAIPLTLLCALAYWPALSPAASRVLRTRFAFPWMSLALAGLLVQFFGWMRVARVSDAGKAGGRLLLVSAGLAMTLLGATCVRECIRLSDMEIQPLLARHAHAAGVGGFAVFLGFAVLNILLMAWAVAIVVRRDDSSAAAPAPSPTPSR